MARPVFGFPRQRAGVEAEFQGKPVDFKALIRDTATARFTVPLAR